MVNYQKFFCYRSNGSPCSTHFPVRYGEINYTPASAYARLRTLATSGPMTVPGRPDSRS